MWSVMTPLYQRRMLQHPCSTSPPRPSGFRKSSSPALRVSPSADTAFIVSAPCLQHDTQAQALHSQ